MAADAFTTVDEWDQPVVDDFRRDHNGRPLILQPDGTRLDYTRSSTAAKTIADRYKLEQWIRRNGIYGMAYDASLVARLIALGGNPDTWDKPTKEKVNKIFEDAETVAKAHKGADIGTAVHHLTHRLDRGEDVAAGIYQDDLEAYTTAMEVHGLLVVEEYVECRMVNDLLKMAGSCDRIVYDSYAKQYRIADIKTGDTTDFGGLEWAAQLAAYAGGQLYDVTTEQRVTTPPIDQTVGYIIHLPAGQGRCTIHEVDLVAGHRAAELANEIRAIRTASKKWITPKSTWVLSKTSDPDQPAVEDAWADKDAVSVSDGAGLEAQAQTQGRAQPSPALSPPSETAAASQIVAPEEYSVERLAGEDSIPSPAETAAGDTDFPPVAPQPAPTPSAGVGAPTRPTDAVNDSIAKAADQADVAWAPGQPIAVPDVDESAQRRRGLRPRGQVRRAKRQPPDEGDTAFDIDVSTLQREYNRLPAEAQTWVGSLVTEGKNAGVPWNTGGLHSVRRYELGRAVVALAGYYAVEFPDGAAVVERVIQTLLQEADVTTPAGPLGAAIGSLDATEATRFAQLVDEYLAPGRCGVIVATIDALISILDMLAAGLDRATAWLCNRRNRMVERHNQRHT